MSTEDCIIYHLAKAHQHAQKIWNRLLSPLGITPVQAMVLGFLGETNSLTAVELGKKAVLDGATLSGVIDRLESIKLLERKPNPEDRRSNCLFLTASGSEKAKIVSELMEKINKELSNSYSQNEYGELLKGLEIIRSTELN